MKGPQQGVFSVGHPSKYLPRATGLNFSDQTKTNAFLVVSVSDETKGYKSHANREKGIPSLNGSYGQFGTFLLKLDLTFMS